MNALQLAGYVAVVFFAVSLAAKMIKIARMPIHIRWDLYPIPHEKRKGAYGGSYFEEVDWWTKPSNFSRLAEIKAMAAEILFVQSLFHHNRSLWYASFPFHFGLYCLVVFMALLLMGAILGAVGIDIASGSAGLVGPGVHYLTLVTGSAGWILGAIGAVGLLAARTFGNELRKASVRSDYFNLIFLLAIFVAGLVAWLTVDPGYTHMRGFVQYMITFQPAPALPGSVTALGWIVIALLFYSPFTHMTHMFGKYFTYHTVRWEDHPNIRGSKIEKAVTEALGYKLSWAAPHIKKGTWAEAATDWEKQGNE
ncbi:MAG: respiratory nitrate reductase subunit gamma [Candidatus Zixiibacteriota bacterium]